MNTEHRYKFEKGSKKHICPNCGKKRFVRYIDTNTNSYLPKQYGRCDRESNCSYFLNPYKDGYAKAIWKQEQGNNTDWKPRKVKKVKKVNIQKQSFFYPLDILNHTLSGYEQNVFIQNLLKRVAFPFQIKDVENVISLYYLGTIQNGYRKGAITFPFIDIQNNIRAIQVKQFDKDNHTTGTDFLHSIIQKHHERNKDPLPSWLKAYNMNEKKVSCLFGEHLLSKYPHNPVALVEAPKTAIYGTLYFGFPEQPTNLLWLAVYNLSSLNLNKCRALKGRNVYLFPDLSKDGKAFELWNDRANKIQRSLKGAYFKVSDLLEQLAPQQDKEQGKDLADYLILKDWRLFKKKEIRETPQPKIETVETPQSENSEKCEAVKKTFFSQSKPVKEQPENWNNEIKELENFFSDCNIPFSTIKLNSYSTITDCSLFIESHLATVKSNNGNETFLPYLNRLQELKEFLIEKTLIK